MYRLCPPHRSADENSRCAYTSVLFSRHSLVKLALGHLILFPCFITVLGVFLICMIADFFILVPIIYVHYYFHYHTLAFVAIM